MNEIFAIGPEIKPSGSSPSPTQQAGANFQQQLDEMITETDNKIRIADQAAADFHTGKAKNLHEVMIAMEEANISTRFVVQVRNKMIEAYQEIMRMQL